MKLECARRMFWVLAIAPIVASCDSGTGAAGPQDVSVGFRVVRTSSAAMGPATAPARAGGAPLVLDGTNGRLTLDEVRLVVDRIRLKGEGGSCEEDEGSSGDQDCARFVAQPAFVNLPLDGLPVSAVTSMIDPGTYTELEFKVEDLEDDEDMSAALASVRQEILAEIPDWPSNASAMVVGSFEPTGGTAAPFRVFLQAEIEVEMNIDPPLTVADDGTPSRSLVVDVHPDLWFDDGQGGVLPLSEWDYDATGQVLRLELEMEHGFREVEVEHGG